MIIGVDHTHITIPKGMDEKAKDFYCSFLGLVETEKPDNRKMNGGFWLQLDGCQIHVGVEDGVDRNMTKAHVAYRGDNLEAWRKKFSENNIEFNESDPLPRAEAIQFRDPFGNRVELIQYRNN